MNRQQPTADARSGKESSEKRVETPEAIATDVALSGKDGTLLGQVVDTTGIALANRSVSLTSGSRVVAHGRSDARGYFAFGHLRGGVYQVSCSKDYGFATVRAWQAGTAPRSAKEKVLLVANQQTVRAQHTAQQPSGRLGRSLRDPIIIGGLVAAAVAVPLAVNASKHNEQGTAIAVPQPTQGITEGPASP